MLFFARCRMFTSLAHCRLVTVMINRGMLCFARWRSVTGLVIISSGEIPLLSLVLCASVDVREDAIPDITRIPLPCVRALIVRRYDDWRCVSDEVFCPFFLFHPRPFLSQCLHCFCDIDMVVWCRIAMQCTVASISLHVTDAPGVRLKIQRKKEKMSLL
jgi:hypothetical protein